MENSALGCAGQELRLSPHVASLFTAYIFHSALYRRTLPPNSGLLSR